MVGVLPDVVVVGDFEVAVATESLGYRVALVEAQHLVLADLPLEVACEVDLLWVPSRHFGGQPACSTLRVILEARNRMPHTVVDFAYSSQMWASPDSAVEITTPLVSQCTVALGSPADFSLLLGSIDASDAAGKMLVDGVQLSVVRDDYEVLVADVEGLVATINRGPSLYGSKARSDGVFAAAIAHGLMSGWTAPEMVEFANTGYEPLNLD